MPRVFSVCVFHRVVNLALGLEPILQRLAVGARSLTHRHLGDILDISRIIGVSNLMLLNRSHLQSLPAAVSPISAALRA